MAIKIDEVAVLLDRLGLKYLKKDVEHVFLWMATKKYQREGQNVLMLVIKLEEDGEYFKLFAPHAFSIKAEKADVFLRACAMIQWRTKLIQFEFNEADGEIRPIIEFPLEDGTLTARQLGRCVSGITQIVDEFFPTLAKARDEGALEFSDSDRLRSLAILMDVFRRLTGGGAAPKEAQDELRRLASSLGGGEGGGKKDEDDEDEAPTSF